MKDIAARIDKLEQDAIDCDLIAKLAVDPQKKATFITLAQEYRVMANRLREIIIPLADNS